MSLCLGGRCVQMVVFAGPKLFKHTVWKGGGLCVRVRVCTRGRSA